MPGLSALRDNPSAYADGTDSGAPLLDTGPARTYSPYSALANFAGAIVEN